MLRVIIKCGHESLHLWKDHLREEQNDVSHVS